MPWKYIERIYCINLKESVRRKKHMEKEFARLLHWDSNRPSVKFLEAISPSHPMYQKHVSVPGRVDLGLGDGPRCFCVVGGEKGADAQKCMHRRRKMKPAEIAICLSHYAVYQDMIRENLSWVMVCEDDIRFSEGFSEMIDQVCGSDRDQAWVSGEPTIICLGGRNSGNASGRQQGSRAVKWGQGRFRMERSQKGIYSNYCYLVNFAAAELLVEHFWPIRRPEDSYKRWLSNQGMLVSYVVKPSMIQELSAGINSERPIFHRLSKATNLNAIPEMRGAQEKALGVEIKGGIRSLKKSNEGDGSAKAKPRKLVIGSKKTRGAKPVQVVSEPVVGGQKPRILITTGRFGRKKTKVWE